MTGDTWRKTVRRSQHMLHQPPAWAGDTGDLERAEHCGVAWLELYEAEQGVLYRVALKTLRERGRRINRGCGPQVMLPLGYWWQTRGDAPVEEHEPAAEQLSLFEVRS